MEKKTKKQNRTKSVLLNVRVTPEMAEKLRGYAKKNNVKISALIIEGIEKQISKK